MTVTAERLRAALAAEGFQFLRWADWYASGHPEARWTNLHLQALPARRHWVHHSVTSAAATPVAAAQSINNIGIQRFGKMSYPFLIHRDGTIIQGCYPYVGAHTKGYNSTTLAGCNIGNYEHDIPTDIQIRANGALIRVGRELGMYIAAPAINGHRDAVGASTACPGANLYAKVPEIARLAFLTSPTPAPPTVPAQEDSMRIFVISGTPYKFLHRGGRDFLALSSAFYLKLVQSGVPTTSVTNNEFQSLNPFPNGGNPVEMQGSLLHGVSYG